MMKLTYKVTENTDIKRILKEQFNISDRLYKKLKEDRIYVNGDIVSPNISLKKDDEIVVNLDFNEKSDNIIPNKNIAIDILYEDEWLLIVNKQAGIPVHPSLNYYENSLSNGVKAYFEQNNINKKIRPVNRLDKNTSGIVIFAKSEYIQEQLIKQMENGIFHKEYISLVVGTLKGKGIIDKPIARKLPSIMERCISPNGDKAITEYNVIKNYNDYTLVKCKLLTGRTHQIRVHMMSIEHSILGDTLYGTESKLIKRQALHALHINCIHPVNKKSLEITARIPNDIIKLI